MRTISNILLLMLAVHVCQGQSPQNPSNPDAFADPTEKANFTLDLGHTDFKFCTKRPDTFFYTVGGKGDPVQNPYLNVIMVQSIGMGMDQDQKKKFLTKIVNDVTGQKVKVLSSTGTDTLLNGSGAYIMDVLVAVEDKKGELYAVITGNKAGSAIFFSTLLDDKEKWIPQVKAIAQTLKMK